jgi:ferric-dicitrate binding protein FerR (iron transport regulator)
MKYTTYTTLDFVMDEYFQAWVLAPIPESEEFWENWLQLHPEKKAMIKEATLLIQMYGVEERELSATRITKMFQGIRQGIAEFPSKKEEAAIANPQPKMHPIYRKWYTVAAVFIGFLIMTSAVYLTLFNQRTSHATTYGEVKEIILPDGSEVTLNGNSTLHYLTAWQEGIREVWLEGEAYFHVQHLSNQTNLNDKNIADAHKFVVHTNDLDVTVLGTQFNVNNRGDQVKVVLNSGKVKVKVAHAVSGNEIFMEPGEMVAYDTHRKLIGKQIVNPEIYSSWRDNYLVFDDAPFHEVAETLENTYGLQITFENESLSQEIIRGTVPSDDIEILLESLSHIFNLEITQENNKIFIAKK